MKLENCPKCPKCSNLLVIGVDIEGVDEVVPSFKKDTKTCVKCYTTFCHYCENNSDDICMGCNVYYCHSCAEKWEADTGLYFMHGDHNICIECYKACDNDNKDCYIKQAMFIKCKGKYCYFCDNQAVDVCSKCDKFLCNSQCERSTKCCS